MTAQEKVLTDQIAELTRRVDDQQETLRKIIGGMRSATALLPHITDRRL
jgi:hypothetical protein